MLELLLFDAAKDIHYRKTIALLKVFNKGKALRLKTIATTLQTSDRCAIEFIRALAQGGFELQQDEKRRYFFEIKSDRALGRILEATR
jgi:DNA-binding IclR family transcriptional regulator